MSQQLVRDVPMKSLSEWNWADGRVDSAAPGYSACVLGLVWLLQLIGSYRSSYLAVSVAARPRASAQFEAVAARGSSPRPTPLHKRAEGISMRVGSHLCSTTHNNNCQ